MPNSPGIRTSCWRAITIISGNAFFQLFSDPNTQTNWSGLFAMTTLSIIPVVVFMVFQRYLVKGVATTGLKG